MTINVRPVVVTFIGSLVFLSGCATSVAPNPNASHSYHDELGEFRELPRARLGALPFKGPFTLYTAADVSDLGTHTYKAGPLEIDNERERGIVYTRSGGFLDIAHVRNSADMTAYIHARALLAIERGWEVFEFKGHEPSTYRVELCYPDDWEQLDVETRHRYTNELALRLAQRVAFDVMTWHEIITWHGYKSTIVIPESNSAFTYDDIPSHALGVQLAADALRTGRDFDLEMSRLLDEALSDLGAVEGDELDLAMNEVEGAWWDRLRGPERRLLDIGTDDGKIDPWVVNGHADEPRPYSLARMDDIEGRDFSGFYRVQIDPNVLEGFAIRSVIGEDREYIDPETDFPVLIEDIADSLDIERVQDLPEQAARR